MINGNYIFGDLTNTATDPELVAFAESIGFAVLGTGGWFYFKQSSELRWFEEMLQELANVSGHPEVVHAPHIAVDDGFENRARHGTIDVGIEFDALLTLGRADSAFVWRRHITTHSFEDAFQADVTQR